MNAEEWRRRRLECAVGFDRGQSLEVGVADLLQLYESAQRWGHHFDDEIAAGTATSIRSMPALLRRIDRGEQIGTRAEHRIKTVHRLELLGVLAAVLPVRLGELPPPAGGVVTVSTRTTALPTGTDGVALHPNGARTRTLLTYSLVGGCGTQAWSLPVLHEPARAPTDVVRLGLQAIAFARQGREQVRDSTSTAGHAPLGRLPILLPALQPAHADPQTRHIIGPRFALADVPEIATGLASLAHEGVPYLAEGCADPSGRLRLPDRWSLYVGSDADPTGERPAGANGVIVRERQAFFELLFARPGSDTGQSIRRLPDVPGVGHVTAKIVRVPAGRGSMFVRAVGHLSEDGRPSVAITNLGDDTSSLIRLGLAIEGLFGSPVPREICRARAVQFTHRFEIPTQSIVAARRVLGLAAVAYADTVTGRVGRPLR